MTLPPDPAVPDPDLPPAAVPRWNGLSSKFVMIVLILLGTLAAGWPISGLIAEREARQGEVRSEFLRSWGPEQTVNAPVLVVPYDGLDSKLRHYLKIAPARLFSRTVLTPEQRKRGLFTATVYGAAVEMAGDFRIPSRESIEALVGQGVTLHWQDSFILLKARKLTGMAAGDHATWDGRDLPWRNCGEVIRRSEDCEGALLIANTLMAEEPATDSSVPFKATLTLRGTGAFRQVLESRQSTATIAAPWSTPSYDGSALPSDSTVTEEGFEAQWALADHSRPPLWSSLKVADAASQQPGPWIGVELLEPVPTYRMINRASKYAILFVVLSFTVYALFELISGIRIHMVQYGLLGLSLTLFPLLLLSFAEPLGYALGYWLSSGLVLMQASLYTAAVTRRSGPTLIFAVVLSALFGFLYVLLGLETYSLLAGSVALFLMLSAVMAVTQRVDWQKVWR